MQSKILMCYNNKNIDVYNSELPLGNVKQKIGGNSKIIVQVLF